MVDTSVWVDHFRNADTERVALLADHQVLMHPFVVGEVACGLPRNRPAVLDLLQSLPAATAAADNEVVHFIDRRGWPQRWAAISNRPQRQRFESVIA